MPPARVIKRRAVDPGPGIRSNHDRHVKDRITLFLSLRGHTCVREPLQIYLVNTALTFGRDHLGMPRWPVIVDRIRLLLTDLSRPAWREPERGARRPFPKPCSSG
ncbi:hypothetical protein EDD35_7860 [Amycolatopsis thermoflava]|uniref:Uncharacterized protein n=1 Tax=Amycolatopsis thermoflava TaxID=84480 RepID=A0A3N2G6E0_9PSEU|nr:hypothetical protein EDD35_7860 [Amycolatopsis thermoflava]